MFSQEEVRRYSRHLILPEFGPQGQRKLKSARVLCVGAGGLGSPAALYLAAAGVGRLGLVDFDVVDVSNLQRQILHSTTDIGRSKLDSARERLKGLNPEIEVVTHPMRLNRANVLELFAAYDVILDGTDNYATRYLINDACVFLGKPNVSASVFRFEGQVSIFAAPGGPCYRCLYPEPPPAGLVPSCGEGGVLGIVPGVIGTLQATEAIKLIAGMGEPLKGRLLLFDALDMRFREVKVRKNPECEVCGPSPKIRELVDYEQFCGLTGPASHTVKELDPIEARARVGALLLDVRESGERLVNHLPNDVPIPLSDLKTRYTELQADREIIVYCKVGRRSARAVEFLQRLGFESVYNLKGGIDAWIDQFDEDLPRY
jgi:adenylyltransferase/sulfurtransferase